MRSNRVTAALLCATALGVGASSALVSTAEADLPVLDIPRLTGIIADGEVGDWGDAGLRIEILTPNQPNRAPLSDLDGQLRLGWDDEGLLLLAQVTDDYLTEADGVAGLWNGDGMELFLAPFRGSPDVMQYPVAPGATGEQPEARWYLHDFRQTAALTNLTGDPVFAGRATATGYVVEGRVPWAPLDIAPETGRVVAFQLFVNDYDEEGFERLLLYPGERSHADLLNFRELRLAQGGGAPQRVISRVRLLGGPGDRIGISVEVRDHGEGTGYELAARGRSVGSAAADTNGTVLRFSYILEAERLEAVVNQLNLMADGAPLTPIQVPSEYLSVRHVLARGREVRARAAAGEMPHEKVRAAAMVLGWTDLLEQMAVDQGDRDLGEVEKRAGSVEECVALLQGALEDYDGSGDAYARRRGGFYSAYLSSADRSGQIYSLYVPPHYDARRPWPLHVHMHGHGGSFGALRNPGVAPDYLMAFVDGRGQTGYMGLGERDVLEAVADVRRHYSIDENRIYARGGSMGGRGTWSLTTRNPDLFAAALPDCGWADGLFIGNLGNTPVWNFHDETDWTVAIDHSRAAVGELAASGYPVIHTEATGGGHSTAAFALQSEREAWLAAQVRDPHPRRVRHSAATPYRGRAYWVEILELGDPNRPGHVDARFAAGHTLYLTTTNVRRLAVDLPAALCDRSAPLTVAAATDPVVVAAPLPERLFISWSDAGEIEVSAADSRPVRSYRPYIAGGLNYIWSSGEPFVIVRPTQGGDAELLAHRAAVCDFLSRETGSTYREQMPIGQIPVVDDVAVTDRMMEDHNLVLVGPASANGLLQRLMRDLPVRERGDDLLIGEERLPFEGRLYNLFHYNPEAPQRYLAVISAAAVDSLAPWDFNDFVNHEGAYGFHLKEVDPRRREVRRLRWTEHWRLQLEPDDGDALPHGLARAATWDEAFRLAACAATGSDFSLDWQDHSAESHAWDPALTTWGDLRADLDRPTDFYRGTLTGEELVDLAAAAGDSLSWAGFVPDLVAEEIRPGSLYRLCLPANLAWALASELHYNLPQVEWARTDDLWQQFERMQRRR